MIMPYGRKATHAEPGRGPAEINFNALWDHGYVPAIKAAGDDWEKASPCGLPAPGNGLRVQSRNGQKLDLIEKTSLS